MTEKRSPIPSLFKADGDKFTASEQRDAAFKSAMLKENAKTDAKTAKLRALRLAKEAADAEAAKLAPPKAPVKRKARVKPETA